MIEQRRYARVQIDCPATFSIKGEEARREGLAKDISLGGMFVETSEPAAFAASVVIHVQLPGATAPLDLPATVRWVRDGGMGVQFGLLGARETHLITEIGRKP